MPVDEFDIIRRHFVRTRSARDDVIAGIGDDAALLQVPPRQELVICTDTLVAGRHFPAGTHPAAIGHKSLAVNLSDLAAMGADPAWATLALTVPGYDEAWMDAFMRGFFQLADLYNIELIGGDTTRGPLSVTVQAHGFVPHGQAVLRRGAQPGDRIYVTGTLGDAGLALYLVDAAGEALRRRLDFPAPRIVAGRALREQASAAIDVSDGLLADLGHLLEIDGLGATLQIDALPRSREFLGRLKQAGVEADTLFYELPLAAGDDYELCFTVTEDKAAALEAAIKSLDCDCTRIGMIDARPGIRCLRQDTTAYHPEGAGYLHFGDPHGR
ncbi:MAG: thiamine-phosphate kinase [Gammaproteobacteria bacterium]